jgi:hypothetical protein
LTYPAEYAIISYSEKTERKIEYVPLSTQETLR